MLDRRHTISALVAAALTGLSACGAGLPGASEARKDVARAGLSIDAQETLDRLVASQPDAARIMSEAKALLIFPDIIKGGFGLAAASGDGVWQSEGETQGYYRSVSASVGMQAGLSRVGYVMAFMDQEAIDYVRRSDGWEVGVGPAITVADLGFVTRFSTTTLHEGIVVFFVDLIGFYAGSGIEGTKITRL